MLPNPSFVVLTSIEVRRLDDASCQPKSGLPFLVPREYGAQASMTCLTSSLQVGAGEKANIIAKLQHHGNSVRYIQGQKPGQGFWSKNN